MDMRAGIALTLALAVMAGAFAQTSTFTPLNKDGIHDTDSPAFGLLQEPAEAFQQLPLDHSGNVDWMTALQLGKIEPRTSVTGKEHMTSIDLDIIMKNTASLPNVLFRHKTHTQWMTCSNCHTQIFMPQVGGNFITMAGIMEGEHCGICHGKVAFPPLECSRCHSINADRKGLR